MNSEVQIPRPEDAGRIHDPNIAHEAALGVEEARNDIIAAKEMLDYFKQVASVGEDSDSVDEDLTAQAAYVKSNSRNAIHFLNERDWDAIEKITDPSERDYAIQNARKMIDARERVQGYLGLAAERDVHAAPSLQDSIDYLPEALSRLVEARITEIDRLHAEDAHGQLSENEQVLANVPRAEERMRHVAARATQTLVGK